MCNNLQDEFSEIKFTEYGLINEDPDVVAKMSDQIQGLGEPVNWIPVQVYRL